MKLVIDIEDYDREYIVNDGYYIPDQINWKIAKAIIDGTPLPKGHGRLIDADALRKSNEEYLIPSPTDREEKMQNQMVKWINYDITNALTIIEADKEESNADSD